MENILKNEICKEVIELAEKAKAYSEINAACVLFALAGSIKGESDFMLAKKIQEYIKDTLLPKVESDIINSQARNN